MLYNICLSSLPMLMKVSLVRRGKYFSFLHKAKDQHVRDTEIAPRVFIANAREAICFAKAKESILVVVKVQ